MPTYQVTHTSTYNFGDVIEKLNMTCCLKPISSIRQDLVSFKLMYQPLTAHKTETRDEFDNDKHSLQYSSPLQRINITSVSVVSVKRPDEIEQADIDVSLPESSQWKDLFDTEELQQVNTAAKRFIGEFNGSAYDSRCFIDYLMQKICSTFRYDVSATNVNTSLMSLFAIQRGVCQDFARVAIAVLQSIGVPTMYVSGYLYTSPKPNQMVQQVASHAWVSVYLNNLGWIDFDPTNNQWVDENYITLARGRDYIDIIPVQGHAIDACQQRLKVTVTIEQLQESTRRTA